MLGKRFAFTSLIDTTKTASKQKSKFSWQGSQQVFDEGESEIKWCANQPNNYNGDEWCTILDGVSGSSHTTANGNPCLFDGTCYYVSNLPFDTICQFEETCWFSIDVFCNKNKLIECCFFFSSVKRCLVGLCIIINKMVVIL